MIGSFFFNQNFFHYFVSHFVFVQHEAYIL